jgi:hypothetical protein
MERQIRRVVTSPNGQLPPGEGATLLAAAQCGEGITWEQTSIVIATNGRALARSGIGYRARSDQIRLHTSGMQCVAFRHMPASAACHVLLVATSEQVVTVA